MAIPAEPLRSEHRELLPHLDELRVLADGIGRWSTHWTDRVAGTVTFLRQDLVPHARAEEAVLYPEVERLLGAPGGRPDDLPAEAADAAREPLGAARQRRG